MQAHVYPLSIFRWPANHPFVASHVAAVPQNNQMVMTALGTWSLTTYTCVQHTLTFWSNLGSKIFSLIEKLCNGRGEYTMNDIKVTINASPRLNFMQEASALYVFTLS